MNDKAQDDLGHIRIIREEANNVKDCFTRFSFQALAFYSVLIAAAISLQEKYPLIYFALIFGIILLLIVSRIGTYKYSTANRNYGFELYFRNALKPEKEKIMSWEEALRAWRIVQASIFQSFYYTGFINRHKLSSPFKNEKLWFKPGSLINLDKKVEYYAGGYLRTILTLNLYMSILGVLPFLFPFIHHLFAKKPFSILEVSILDWVFVATAVLLFLLIGFWFIRQFRLLRVLEGEMLSIFSCGIMWQVVGICHYEASMKTNNIIEYTKYLSDLSVDILKNPKDIPAWIDNKKKVLQLKLI